MRCARGYGPERVPGGGNCAGDRNRVFWAASSSGETKGDAMATYWASMACSISIKLGGVLDDLEPTLAAMERGEVAALPPELEAMLRWRAKGGPIPEARLVEVMDSLVKELPRWRDGPDATGMDFLAWYAGTLATSNAGGAHWSQWYPALHQALVVHQRTDGAHAGSWEPVDEYGKQGGRVYATAMNVLSLSVGQPFGRAAPPAGAKKK